MISVMDRDIPWCTLTKNHSTANYMQRAQEKEFSIRIDHQHLPKIKNMIVKKSVCKSPDAVFVEQANQNETAISPPKEGSLVVENIATRTHTRYDTNKTASTYLTKHPAWFDDMFDRLRQSRAWVLINVYHIYCLCKDVMYRYSASGR